MNFSEKYLNRILSSAIEYHNFKESIIAPLPDSYTNKDMAIESLKKSLQYEAYQNFKEPQDTLSDNPILCAVNLKTNEPGIIISKKNNKLCIHTKYDFKKDENKNIKQKSKNDLDLLSDKTYKRIQKRKEKLERKYEEKLERKKNIDDYKTCKNDNKEYTKILKSQRKEQQIL